MVACIAMQGGVTVTVSSLDARVLEQLRSTFGFESFLSLQEDIVRSVIEGRDVFVLMPTGGGKSLCYQLPALVLDGPTVVVSPLIALMKDQVDALGALGVNAAYINSSLPQHEIARRQAALARGDYSLVYVAPERLMMPDFLRTLAEAGPAFFAIDEAHCISEWGHDFRPEYRRLRELRAAFPDVPIGAFTATATHRVQADIVAQLGLQSAASFRGSFNRQNLYYEVRAGDRRYEDLTEYLRGNRGASGIVYCFSRKGTDDLAERLNRDGFHAVAYHAGLDPEERRTRQESFIRDDVPLIVATIAFGMGIDKSDVRFVVHYDLPKSLEGYYQESGRAGRDGERSDCILFFNRGDIVKQRRFLREKPTAEERRVAEWQLQHIAGWAEASTCRRRALLAYFGEELDGQEGPCCDNCTTPLEEEDYTVPAQMLLSCVKRTGERFGLGHVIQVLRGARTERIRSLRHDALSTYGIGRHLSGDEWRHIGRELMRLGCLSQSDGEYRTVGVSDLGNEVLFRGRRVTLPKPRMTRGNEPVETIPHPDLFERLRAVRKRLADDRNLPPYAVFNDSALKHMAAVLPTSSEVLLRTPGIGERKAQIFGPAMLSEITDYIRETGATPAAPPPPASATHTRREPGETVRASLALFREGHTLLEIAAIRSLTESTVASHLATAMEAGEKLDIDRLVHPEKRRAIEIAMSELGPDYLGPIRERLGESYSYSELHCVRGWLRASHKAGNLVL